MRNKWETTKTSKPTENYRANYSNYSKRDQSKRTENRTNEKRAKLSKNTIAKASDSLETLGKRSKSKHITVYK
jgi:hypothetical protein